MAFKRFSSFIFSFLIAFSTTSIHAEKYEAPEYTHYVDEIVHSFANQIKKEFGFRCNGSGGSMPYDVEKITIQFDANRIVSIEEARELEVKITEKFIQCINADEKIRPFLREYPFPSSRASVMISFKVSKKFSLSNNQVELVFQTKNKIFYQATNKENPYLYDTLKEEPYEEALRIVQNKTTP